MGLPTYSLHHYTIAMTHAMLGRNQRCPDVNTLDMLIKEHFLLAVAVGSYFASGKTIYSTATI